MCTTSASAAAISRPRQQALARLLTWGVLLGLLAAALAISFFVSPADIDGGGLLLSPTCLMRQLFGVQCLTCGMTRAFCALSHGQLSQALQYNRLAPVAYVLTWVAAGGAAVGVLRSALELRRARAGSVR